MLKDRDVRDDEILTKIQTAQKHLRRLRGDIENTAPVMAAKVSLMHAELERFSNDAGLYQASARHKNATHGRSPASIEAQKNFERSIGYQSTPAEDAELESLAQRYAEVNDTPA